MVVSFVLFLMPSFRNDMKLLPIPCAMAFAGIWIERAWAWIVPGFIPSPIGEVTEYYPTFVEWLMVLGIWAFGFFILTILLKGAIGILLGDIRRAVRCRLAGGDDHETIRMPPRLALGAAPLGCGGGAGKQAGSVAAPPPPAEGSPSASKAARGHRVSRSARSQTRLARTSVLATTGAALWYGDPTTAPVPMGKMPGWSNLPKARRWSSRAPKTQPAGACGVACHNGVIRGFPTRPSRCPSPRWKPWCPTPRPSSTAAAASGAWTATTPRSATSWSTTSATRSARPAAAPVRQVPRRQAARLARRHPRQAHRRLHQHRQRSAGSPAKCHNPHNVQDGETTRGFVPLQARDARSCRAE